MVLSLSVRIYLTYAPERVACPLLFHLHFNNPSLFLSNMKPTVTEDEFEDAEEENKFINEVCVKDEIERPRSC
jgi:hypothetical protein